MANIGNITVTVDASQLKAALAETERELRQLNTPQARAGIWQVAALALTASKTTRRVTRRALLGLGWWRT